MKNLMFAWTLSMIFSVAAVADPQIQKYSLTDFSGLKLKIQPGLCSGTKHPHKKSPGYVLIVRGAVGVPSGKVGTDAKPENLGDLLFLPVGCSEGDAQEAIQVLNTLAHKQAVPEFTDPDLQSFVEHFNGGSNQFDRLEVVPAEIQIITDVKGDFHNIFEDETGEGRFAALTAQLQYINAGVSIRHGIHLGFF